MINLNTNLASHQPRGMGVKPSSSAYYAMVIKSCQTWACPCGIRGRTVRPARGLSCVMEEDHDFVEAKAAPGPHQNLIDGGSGMIDAESQKWQTT